jgi:hypothetical protein
MIWTSTITKGLAVLALVGIPAAVSAQHETIPEALAHGSQGRIRSAGSGVGPSVNDILLRTDMVVRGVLGEPRSYLSDDQKDVFTDYPIIDPILVYRARVLTETQPGLISAMTVTQLGGTVVLNGLTYTQREESLLPLKPGVESLFLLQRVGNRYLIAGTFLGAFSISGGTLTSLAKDQHFAAEFRGIATTDAITDMLNRLRTLRP